MHQLFPWQQTRWTDLKGRIPRQLPHSLLFAGPKNLGKLNFAQVLAEYLLCEHPQPLACGHCQACQWLNAGTHPDLICIQPEANSTTIKIDQIRRLINRLSHTSQQGGYKLAIIEPAEQMNLAAANALLKTLEEPPGNTLLILVSHTAHQLPATVRSRCQRIRFAIPKLKLTQPWLVNQISSEIDAQLLLALAEGLPLKALELANRDQLMLFQQAIDHLSELLLQKTEPMAVAKQLMAIDLKLLLDIFYTLSGDLIRLQLGGNIKDRVYFSSINKIRNISQLIDILKIYKFVDKVLEVKRALIQHINLNAQLQLEALLLQWQQLSDGYPS